MIGKPATLEHVTANTYQRAPSDAGSFNCSDSSTSVPTDCCRGQNQRKLLASLAYRERSESLPASTAATPHHASIGGIEGIGWTEALDGGER
jgi:hypothetical protein